MSVHKNSKFRTRLFALVLGCFSLAVGQNPAVAANPRLFHDGDGQVMTASEAVTFLAANYHHNIAKASVYAHAPAKGPKSAIDA